MTKMTLTLPLGNNVTKEVWATKDATGDVVGPFLVHRCVDYRRGWTVTHIRCKFSAHAALPTKRRAMWLARELAKLDVWDFDTFEAAKLIPADVLTTIKVLRADAMYGDMQGGEP